MESSQQEIVTKDGIKTFTPNELFVMKQYIRNENSEIPDKYEYVKRAVDEFLERNKRQIAVFS